MKFCGKRCRDRYHKRHVPSGPFEKEANCHICGKPYIRKMRSARYCSKECYARAFHILNMDSQRYKARERGRIRRQANPQLERARSDASHARAKLRRPWKGCLFSTRQRAQRELKTFDLTNAWAAARWTGKCEVTGLAFEFESLGAGPNPRSASIDRIDPSRGYTQGNARFILFAVNALKGRGTDQQMFMIAEAIVAARPK